MRLTQVTRYGAIAGAVLTPLMMSAPASHASTGGGTGSAYALAATGAVPIGPISAVHVGPGQEPSRKSLVELPPNPIIEASILNAAAAPGHARASVADLRLLQAGLSAHLITAKCARDHGDSALVKVFLHGKKLAVSARPNTTISVAPEKVGVAPQVVKVVINKQVHNPDHSFTVTALEVTLALPAGKTEVVSISSATCGPGNEEANPPSAPNNPSNPPAKEPPGTAPEPTPVPGDLPVTG